MRTLQSKYRLNADVLLRIIIVLVFSFFMNGSIKAQEVCGTPASPPPAWLFDSSLKSDFLPSSSYVLKIFVHVIQSNSGAGLSINAANDVLNTLNNGYKNTGIQFCLLGSEIIKNDAYFVELDYWDESALFNKNTHSDAIDIYVLGETTKWVTSSNQNIAGRANGIPSTALIIKPQYHTVTTMSHEMGHCLGLYHTHHGTVNEGGGNNCPEYVDGSNSTTCGDFISDTPADPDHWLDCAYIGTGRDGHGDVYTPDPTIIMSYAGTNCRTRFTSLQIQRMKDFINNTSSLTNVIYRLKISGSYSAPGVSGTFSTADGDDHAELYVSAGAAINIRFDAIPIKEYSYRWTNANAYPSLHAGLVGENGGQISVGTSAASGVYSIPITIMPERTPTFTFVLNVSGRMGYSISYSRDESVIKLSNLNTESRRMLKSNDLKCLIYRVGTGEQVGGYRFLTSDMENKIDVSNFNKAIYNVVVVDGDNIICSEKISIN